ncbi:FCD domain-containing protein [Roseateles amylovorans]|uniref:FCD domain-containing protein n=1 Tax=Roseateles amylovorans TaxID=2978473 RepID=A0ABY6AZP1_9BURK|nr:FCD domain-containing protein [Roseateles amylovorans]UXH78397.1 FCD domain-containing protein [Roseateles amylovorans]
MTRAPPPLPTRLLTAAMSPQHKLAEDILQTRAALTELLIRTASPAAAPEVWADAKALAAAFQAAVRQGDLGAITSAESAFRWRVLQMGHNDLALDLLRIGQECLARICGGSPLIRDAARRGLDIERLMAALECGDSETAVQAAMAHIEMDRRDFLAMTGGQ